MAHDAVMPPADYAAQVLATVSAVRDAGRAVVLVEGPSDRIALETFAAREGRDLERVAVVELGGATNIGRWLAALGAPGAAVTVAGLYDVAEERYYVKALRRLRWDSSADRESLRRLGFHACVDDLEDELVRAVGVPRVLDVMAAQGDLAAFRTFQNQPAHRPGPAGREDVVVQLRRFIACGSGRKTRYARLLVEAVGSSRAPSALSAVLDRVSP